MYQVIIVIHILLGLGIIGLVLMQQGKGADAGATFGGGASGSVFGAQGAASFLSRTTAILATMFFITSLGLAWISSNRTGAAVDFMGTPTVEKEAPELGLPDVDGTNSKQTLPAPPATENKTQPAPVEVPSVAQPPAAIAPTLGEIAAPVAPASEAVEESESELVTETPKPTPAKKK
jgi:preprotein translocase subunit SecG